MSSFDRVLLALYTSFLTFAFVALLAMMAGWTALQHMFRDLVYQVRPEVFWSIMAILILAGVRLFWVSINKSEHNGRYVVLTESALGQVRVSVQAIENLVVKVASKINGVREVKARIFSTPQGVGMQIRAVVTPDLNIPEVSEHMQSLVKERVQEVTGITVNKMKVSIENIAVSKPRVE